MKLSILALVPLMGFALASPVKPSASNTLATRQQQGSYTVPGLGARKKAIFAAGGTSLDLAIAMLETENLGTDYTYGDGKTGDSTNFGIFKQNWGLLRESADAFKGQTEGQVANGAVLNSDLNLDVASRQQSEAFYGQDRWFAGHRNGATGLANPNTSDIENYKSAVFWIKSQLDSSTTYLTDDTRFYVQVVPI